MISNLQRLTVLWVLSSTEFATRLTVLSIIDVHQLNHIQTNFFCGTLNLFLNYAMLMRPENEGNSCLEDLAVAAGLSGVPPGVLLHRSSCPYLPTVRITGFCGRYRSWCPLPKKSWCLLQWLQALSTGSHVLYKQWKQTTSGQFNETT